MDFDLSLAKERSMKNPVYYVQYAAVRCVSILRKSKIINPKSETNFKFKTLKSKTDFSLLDTPADMNLMRTLARFPEIIEEAAEKRSPQTLTRYAIDLAREFHNFYEREQVLPAELYGKTTDSGTRFAMEYGAEKCEKILRKSASSLRESALAKARLALIQATLIVFKNIFGLLGIGLPREM